MLREAQKERRPLRASGVDVGPFQRDLSGEGDGLEQQK